MYFSQNIFNTYPTVRTMLVVCSAIFILYSGFKERVLTICFEITGIESWDDELEVETCSNGPEGFLTETNKMVR